ncbi:hypothetical protein KIN20_034832 [Parelaphostrongylus tenuis]|uniref:Uncharacterized protein n=1 Tax=Parelaphostrongylus tenuis TaxID=148309 RepID=A0AAD5RAQ7_PARTN|nr:hypothetical protein KIN20_034832 [Parelaphostrongylus tenuis]
MPKIAAGAANVQCLPCYRGDSETRSSHRNSTNSSAYMDECEFSSAHGQCPVTAWDQALIEEFSTTK